jgi:hypothetical protein
MSFSVNHKGAPGDVAGKVSNDSSLPEGVKQFILAGVSALTAKAGVAEVSVSAHGHLHDGQDGNYNVTSATITVEPIAAEKAAEGENVADGENQSQA